MNKLLKFLPACIYLQLQYYKNYKVFLNLRNPKTYADKLAYLKLHHRNPLLTKLVDKYTVRDFVRERIGEEYLVPLFGVYKSTDEIPWNKLPEKYVLKCTHDSASIVLHPSNDGFDRDAAIAKLDEHLHRNLYDYGKEYPYKNVEPQIICEKFLESDTYVPEDYKIMCFGGKPKYIILDQGRFVDHHRDIYDTNWTKLNISTDHKQTDVIRSRPQSFEKMLELASILSTGFNHVRVDFYDINGKIYFGEMTFFPWGGVIRFFPEEWNYKLGELIKI